MQKLLNPIVGLSTFFIGLFAVSMWLIAEHQNQQKPEFSILEVSSATVAPPQISAETEKYAVYSALIKDMYLKDNIKLLVIGRGVGCDTPTENEEMDEISNQMEEYAIKKFPFLQQETINDFRAKSKQCIFWEKQLDIPAKYVLVTEKHIEQLFKKDEDGWQGFYSKYPNSSGIIGLSNVGFNREMNQAFVATSKSCGGLCGAGYYVLLEKENGVWKVSSQTMTWVS
jgi:hypothetical protein